MRPRAFEMNGISTTTHINVLLLGSYNMLLGMDWLHIHRTMIDCYSMALKYLGNDGEMRILQVKKKHTPVRIVITMQEKHSSRTGCVLFGVHISSKK